MAAFIRKVTKQAANFPSTFLKAQLAVALVGLALGVLLFPGLSLGQVIGDEITISNNPDYPQKVDKSEVTAPCLAYDPTGDRFLVVWTEWRKSSIYLWGRFVGADGVPQGEPFAICTREGSQAMHPQPVYDAKNNRFLVVWSDNRHQTDWGWRYWSVYGRYIASDGNMVNDFNISPLYDPDHWYGATHAYTLCDQATGNFLVIMTTSPSSPYNLKGKILDGSSGYVDITNFESPNYGVWRPVAAYDSANRRFLVAYGVDWINQSFIMILNADGSTFLEEKKIAGPPKYGLNSAAFDPVNQRSLVVWNSTVSTDAQGYCRWISGDGNTIGDEITLLAGESAYDVTYDPANEKFLVMVTGYNHNSTPILGQQLNLDGTPNGDTFTIPTETGRTIYSAYVAAGSQGRSLVVYTGNMGGEPTAAYGRIVTFTPPNPDVDLSGAWALFTSSTSRRGVTTVKGSLTVSNSGDQAAGAFKVAYYLSDNDSLEGSDTLIKTAKIRSLAAGASTTLTLNWKSSTDVSGKHIIAVVDSGNQVTETDETNNTVPSAAIP